MTYIKITFLTILKKAVLIFLGSILGGISGYFFNSIIIGVIIFLGFTFTIYWWFLGPMHFVTKAKIKLLVEQDILIDTLISPYAREFTFLDDKEWFEGEGLFDRFVDTYKTQATKKGIAFYCLDIPYLPLYILPWSKIIAISKNTKLIKEIEFDDTTIIYDLTLIKNEHIFLPMSEVTANLLHQSD